MKIYAANWYSLRILALKQQKEKENESECIDCVPIFTILKIYVYYRFSVLAVNIGTQP